MGYVATHRLQHFFAVFALILFCVTFKKPSKAVLGCGRWLAASPWWILSPGLWPCLSRAYGRAGEGPATSPPRASAARFRYVATREMKQGARESFMIA